MADARDLNDFDRVLAVKGHSDLVFFAECLEHVGKLDRTFIKDFNGKQDLIAKLETFVTPQLLAEKAMIGIVVDANGNAVGTFQSIQTTLATLTNQTVPSPGSWTSGSPRIGIFVCPGNNSAGEIESLVWSAWRGDEANAESAKCIEDFISCMHQAGIQAQSPDKGRVSALLAIRNDDDPRLGPGARANVFNFDRPEFASLMRFLSEL